MSAELIPVKNINFWKNKKVLLTGHTGFKGSWLTLLLKHLGAEIIGYSLPPPTNPNLFEIAQVSDGMISVIDDIRNLSNLKKIILSYKPDIVIHMAAQSLVRYSYRFPAETYETNVIGTVNVLESVRLSNSVKVALIVTSDKCYDNRESLSGYKESDPIGGNDPYSSSKGCAELVTNAYRRSFFPPEKYNEHKIAIASARAGNVIGGGDWAADRLLPDIMRSWLLKKPVLIRMPDAVRPWQYVLDPLVGYLLLIEKLWHDGMNYSEAWNFGPPDDNCKSVKWILDKLKEYWGDNALWICSSNNNPKESVYLKLDSSKTRSRIGWTALYNISDTLEIIVEWYKAYDKGKNMRDYCYTEIKDYLKKLLAKNEMQILQ